MVAVFFCASCASWRPILSPPIFALLAPLCGQPSVVRPPPSDFCAFCASWRSTEPLTSGIRGPPPARSDRTSVSPGRFSRKKAQTAQNIEHQSSAWSRYFFTPLALLGGQSSVLRFLRFLRLFAANPRSAVLRPPVFTLLARLCGQLNPLLPAYADHLQPGETEQAFHAEDLAAKKRRRRKRLSIR